MIAYRHADPRFPFLWESAAQPPARWHGEGEGPVQYLADTPDGAWAEFLRHEAIVDGADLDGIARDLWAVELTAVLPEAEPKLAPDVLTGGLDTYAACRAEARRLRREGSLGLIAPSAALLLGAAAGWHVAHGAMVTGSARDGKVVVLFGSRPDLTGWCASFRGKPAAYLLARVRQLDIP